MSTIFSKIIDGEIPSDFVYEDELGLEGFPRLKRRRYRVDQRDGPGYHQVSYEFAWRSGQLPDSEEFRLAYYGIPEPVIGSASSFGFPWWVNGLIGGVFCLFVGFVIKRFSWPNLAG